MLDNGCQLSHYVVRVSDVPLGEVEAGSDAELTDHATGGADRADSAGEDHAGPDPVEISITVEDDPGVDSVELLLPASEPFEDSSGTTWTVMQALRASPTADVLLSVLLNCPETAALDQAEQVTMLGERLEQLTVVAERP